MYKYKYHFAVHWNTGKIFWKVKHWIWSSLSLFKYWIALSYILFSLFCMFMFIDNREFFTNLSFISLLTSFFSFFKFLIKIFCSSIIKWIITFLLNSSTLLCFAITYKIKVFCCHLTVSYKTRTCILLFKAKEDWMAAELTVPKCYCGAIKISPQWWVICHHSEEKLNLRLMGY